MTSSHELEYTNSWQERQDYAESMQPIIGRLYRNRGIEIAVYGRPLVNASPIDIIKAHKTVAQFEGTKLRLRESFPFLEAISKMDLNSARIDIGKLAYGYLYNDAAKGRSVEEYLTEELAEIANAERKEPRDVVLYGFGRIGRLLARLLIEKSGPYADLRLRAIVVRGGKDGDLEKRASLLRRDSIHGPFNGSITIDKERNAIKANGSYIQVIYANSPNEIDYTAYGIDNALIVDNTGIWKDEAGLGKHLQSTGVKKVLLTAPAGGDIKNVVYGVNNDTVGDDTIVSAASCTTNAITPTLNVLNDEYGIVNGHVETIHSFTNDQNLVDNYHKADRRGRSAVMNMVITSTGAAKAVGKALPELNGKLTGNAIRVPTPNVSLAILNVNLKTAPASAGALNEFLRKMANSSTWQSQIAYTDSTEAVSTDFVGTTHVGIIDAQATILTDNQAIVYVWYDNEVGYSTQVLRLATQMAGISYAQIPA